MSIRRRRGFRLVGIVRPPLNDAGGMIQATPRHADWMATIHAQCFPARERWGADAIALQLEMPGSFGLLHEAGGLVMWRLAADEAELLTLAVDPSVRRQGLGGALLRGAMDRAGAGGAAEMFLEVSVRNQPAWALYARSGFVRVGQRAGYFADGSDALILRAGLEPSCV